MVEGGNAEKFPDKWDIQFLGNIVASQLASGTPADFLIKSEAFPVAICAGNAWTQVLTGY